MKKTIRIILIVFAAWMFGYIIGAAFSSMAGANYEYHYSENQDYYVIEREEDGFKLFEQWIIRKNDGKIDSLCIYNEYLPYYAEDGLCSPNKDTLSDNGEGHLNRKQVNRYAEEIYLYTIEKDGHISK